MNCNSSRYHAFSLQRIPVFVILLTLLASNIVNAKTVQASKPQFDISKENPLSTMLRLNITKTLSKDDYKKIDTCMIDADLSVDDFKQKKVENKYCISTIFGGVKKKVKDVMNWISNSKQEVSIEIKLQLFAKCLQNYKTFTFDQFTKSLEDNRYWSWQLSGAASDESRLFDPDASAELSYRYSKRLVIYSFLPSAKEQPLKKPVIHLGFNRLQKELNIQTDVDWSNYKRGQRLAIIHPRDSIYKVGEKSVKKSVREFDVEHIIDPETTENFYFQMKYKPDLKRSQIHQFKEIIKVFEEIGYSHDEIVKAIKQHGDSLSDELLIRDIKSYSEECKILDIGSCIELVRTSEPSRSEFAKITRKLIWFKLVSAPYRANLDVAIKFNNIFFSPLIEKDIQLDISNHDTHRNLERILRYVSTQVVDNVDAYLQYESDAFSTTHFNDPEYFETLSSITSILEDFESTVKLPFEEKKKLKSELAKSLRLENPVNLKKYKKVGS